MPTTTYFLDAWKELGDGTRIYPYTGVKGDKKGLFSVNFTNDNKKFEGVSEVQLRAMFDGGHFNKRGTVRMISLNAEIGGQRNAFAPTHYLGTRLSNGSTSEEQAFSAPPLKLFASEISDGQNFHEGAEARVTVNAYERSSTARAACIAHYGHSCQVCDLNFERLYGEIGRGFIHVHHLVRLADIRSEYEVNPIRDLIPVCPNCHAMLHQSEPPLLIAELRSRLYNA